MAILVLLSNGDRAEAETPEAALVTARTLMNDAVDAGAAPRITASFYVDGRAVRVRVSRASLEGAR